MGGQRRIDGAKREEDILSLAKLQHILIRDDSCGDGTDIRKDDRFGDTVLFEVSGKLFGNDQFFVAFVEL
jgi:hypothetical protein